MIPFTGNPLDRASEKRTDAEWIAAKRRDPSSFILPMWRLQPFIIGPEKAQPPVELGLLKPGLCDSLAAPDAACVFLGLEGDNAMFALDISAARSPSDEGPLAGLGHFRDARAAGATLPMKDAAIMGEAKAMIDWHNRHGFCANCGARSALMDGGWRRVCPECKTEHFPRTDPVVIMLAVNGDACLVGRNARFPGNFYSALAGFMEPGESIEEAVQRELMEEVACKVGKVHYHSTQPWPFPSSLMIGCIAEAESRDFKPDGTEIADAMWLPREKAKRLIEGERMPDISVPPAVAIAHHLIKAFANGEY
ncbi:MAG: NAD(+) diphosphatase [Alphaproteobacteria bacterium]|nr:NAD(+) diphosphatase [Alphaproteobacteria bacterium]MBV9905695.1 NAD(+) diphosphatase [Alphaproteobacteria bacterium]